MRGMRVLCGWAVEVRLGLGWQGCGAWGLGAGGLEAADQTVDLAEGVVQVGLRFGGEVFAVAELYGWDFDPPGWRAGAEGEAGEGQERGGIAGVGEAADGAGGLERTNLDRVEFWGSGGIDEDGGLGMGEIGGEVGCQLLDGAREDTGQVPLGDGLGQARTYGIVLPQIVTVADDQDGFVGGHS